MMPIDAVLFDLDDTLLGNDMKAFVPRYFELIEQYAERIADPRVVHDGLLRGTRAMFENEDRARTNADVFWEGFTTHSGIPRSEGEPFFEGFYRTIFPRLEALTQRRPAAARLIALCVERGWPVVIATNPVFPRIAQEERLRWAGIPVDAHDYALVTSYENMHSTKPRTAYFREIAELLGIDPARALMAGNDPEQDIAPARSCRMQTFLVREGATSGPRSRVTGTGTLDDLLALLSAA